MVDEGFLTVTQAPNSLFPSPHREKHHERPRGGAIWHHSPPLATQRPPDGTLQFPGNSQIGRDLMDEDLPTPRIIRNNKNDLEAAQFGIATLSPGIQRRRGPWTVHFRSRADVQTARDLMDEDF